VLSDNLHLPESLALTTCGEASWVQTALLALPGVRWHRYSDAHENPLIFYGRRSDRCSRPRRLRADAQCPSTCTGRDGRNRIAVSHPVADTDNPGRTG